MVNTWTEKAIRQFERAQELKHRLEHMEQGLSELFKYVPDDEKDIYLNTAHDISENIRRRCVICNRKR